MTKKCGKKSGKARNKGGSGGRGKKVADTTTAQNVASAGHQIEDRSAYVEGELEKSSTHLGDAPVAATATAPTGISKTPSAVPSQSTEQETKKDEKDESTAAAASAAEGENEVETALLMEETSRGSIQDAVDKVQASKSGRVSTLDAGPSETGILPEVARKEQQHVAGCPPTESTSNTEVHKAAAEQEKSTETVAQAESATTTTLPERPKEEKSSVSEEEPSTSDAAGLSTHAKRPYETSLFAKEEAKPPKIPKVGETVGAQPPKDDENKTDLDLPKTGSVSAPSAAPATTPDVSAKESSKNELPTGKEAKVPSGETSAEYLTAPAAKAETLESDVAGVSGVAAGASAPAESPKEVPSAREPAATAVSEQPQTSVTTRVAEDLAPAPVSAPNSVADSRNNSADSAQAKSPASGSSSDSVDTQSKLKKEELKKAEEKVEAHRGAMKDIMVDDTNPEINVAQREEAKEEAKKEEAKKEEAKKEEAKKEEAKKEEAKKEEAKKEEAKEEPKEQKETKDTASKPADESQKRAENKAKEAAEKAKEATKEEHKKGGFWSWLKRKVKG